MIRLPHCVVLAATAAAAASFGSVNANLYTCVIYGNNVPSNIKNKIDVDASTLLQKLKDYEGPGYDIVAPGQMTRRDERDLHDAEDESESNNESEQEEDNHRQLSLFDCPNSCSNSGSTFCRSIGCAYCGTCNRNRRDLTFYASSSLRRGLASANSVENSMNKDLAVYCQDVDGCSLWAKIFVVNDDGSLSPAT